MASPFFIVLDLDAKPPLPEASEPCPVLELELEEEEVDAPPRPLWQRVLGCVVVFAINLLIEAITTPG